MGDFIDTTGVMDTPDPELLPDGEEVEFEITDATVYVNENTGNRSIKLNLVPIGYDNAQNPVHFVSLPTDQDDPQKRINKSRMMRDFFRACGLNPDAGIDTDDLKGQRFWALVSVEHSDRYGDQNRVRPVPPKA